MDIAEITALWLVGGIVYTFVGVATFIFVYDSFINFNNLKSFGMALLWPLSWIVMIVGSFIHWLMEK